MELTNGKITLRALRYADSESLARLANNKKIWNTLRDAFPHPYSVDDAKRFIDMVNLQESIMNFVIEYDHEFAGIISLLIQPDVYKHSAEAGYWIGEPFWNKGIATSALTLITDYGFNTLHLQRIFASVFEGNIASQRVLEKCGYECEGMLRKAVIKNNKVLDELRYAILSRR